MPSRRESESDESSLGSLLSWADEREKQRFAALMDELRTTAPPPAAGDRQPDGADEVAKTRADAARLLGVDERTLSKWAADPTFPGKAGTAGQRNGHFPIGAIRRWRATTSGQGGETADADPAQRLRLRKLAAETARREVDLDAKLGTLIDREQAEATITSAIATARSLLEELPEQIAEAISASRPKLRRMARRIARRKVLQVLEALADCVTEDPDDSDDDAPRSPDLGRPDPRAGPAASPGQSARPDPRRVGGRKKTAARPVVPRKSKARPAGRK